MHVLVSVASKHGATGEIGEIIAGVLRDAGLDVATIQPERVERLDDYDAVILGSAVYAGRWMSSAHAFVDRHGSALSALPVWLFSSGPIGDPPMPAGDAPDAVTIAERLGARELKTFAGRLERDQLGFGERAITKILRAPDGDFRDLEEIRTWADAIASQLSPRPAAAR
jgi:menaquinone-dependent protoporphyrinogen oxidase